MADKRRYSFIETKKSKGGIRSTYFAAGSFLCFLVCVALSFFYKGNAGPFIGGIAVSAMLLSMYGFRLGMKSFGEKDVSPTWSVIGSILSGVVMVGWLTLFLTGVGGAI